MLFLYRFNKKALNRLSSNFLRARQSDGIGYPGRFKVNPQKSAFKGSNTWRRWSKPEKLRPPVNNFTFIMLHVILWLTDVTAAPETIR